MARRAHPYRTTRLLPNPLRNWFRKLGSRAADEVIVLTSDVPPLKKPSFLPGRTALRVIQDSPHEFESTMSESLYVHFARPGIRRPVGYRREAADEIGRASCRERAETTG